MYRNLSSCFYLLLQNDINLNQMKKSILTLTFALIVGVCSAQTKPDTTKHYTFKEPDAILIDNLVGQLDVVSGNSDKASTVQYNSIHRAVIRIDSLIKIQWVKYHPAKKGKKP